MQKAEDYCHVLLVLKEDQMENAKADSVVAIFADHNAAETAVKKLTAAGFEMKNLSVVGKGYHTDEKVVGFSTPVTVSSFGAHGVRSGAASGACSWAACL